MASDQVIKEIYSENRITEKKIIGSCIEKEHYLAQRQCQDIESGWFWFIGDLKKEIEEQRYPGHCIDKENMANENPGQHNSRKHIPERKDKEQFVIFNQKTAQLEKGKERDIEMEEEDKIDDQNILGEKKKRERERVKTVGIHACNIG